MPIRTIDQTVVQTSVLEAGAGFRVALSTYPAGAPEDVTAWPLPREVTFPTRREADAWARWVLLGICGFGADGRPNLSAF